MNRNQFDRLKIIHEALRTLKKYRGAELLTFVNARAETPISMRTLKSDIEFLRGSKFNAPIDDRIYQYTKPYSFLEVLNTDEASTLNELKTMLEKIMDFNVIDKFIKPDIQDLSFKLDGKTAKNKIVYFEENTLYQGNEYIKPLYKYIKDKQPLLVKYGPFETAVQEITIHPYFLKEYSNRWYLYGLNHENKKIIQLGLDRIRGFNEKAYISFIENKDFDAEVYFKEMVGVTRYPNDKPIKVAIRIFGSSINYIDTKPIHHSQVHFDDGEVEESSGKSIEYADFEYNLIINYEFKSKLLALGSNAQVREPEDLRKEMKKEVRKLLRRYV